MLGELTAETVANRNNVTVLGRADGPVMMFAHGYGCDQDMWRRLVPYFADDYRVVLFDHVGAGHSDLEAYDREKYGTLILQCTDDLLAPAAVGSYVHQQLGRSSLVQLTATGHCPHVSAPEATAAAILHYLHPHP